MANRPTFSQTQPPRKRRKRVKMIARITSYDYNVQFDMRHKQTCQRSRNALDGIYEAPIHEQSYNVCEGEILMAKEQSKHYRDGQLHCFSFANSSGDKVPAVIRTACLNGATPAAKAGAQKLAKFMIMDDLTYVGVAVTGFDSTSNKYQDMTQGFVATFGGLNTIINTGKKEIRPGDWITIAPPEDLKWENDPFNKFKKQEGIPLDKLQFATVPYKPSSAFEKAQDIIQAYVDFGGGAGAYNAAVTAALAGQNCPSALLGLQAAGFPASIAAAAAAGEQGVRAIMAIDQQAKRLIIGKALSFARQGEPFDIVLGGSPAF